MSGSTERADVQRVEAEAREWRKWATGEQKKPPHNLLAFTTDVLSLAAALRAAEEALRKSIQANSGWCPYCKVQTRHKGHRHAPSCPVGAALAAASTEGTE